ncbi:MAG: SurA N-terminal domain-containing protein [Halieaceae bacterium]|jgi:peptidyl-prolyl cis-trans isomerase D|nr:SurA N-terminal domain-containing protein [Halieaceae bacterium]
MLQNIRQNVQGPAIKVVVWLIVISFSIFGIESILVGGGGAGVAEVNGEEVSPQELQQAVNTQKRRLIAMMGDNFDPTLLDDEVITNQALNSLIGRKLLMQSAESMDLTVSKREIGSVIGGMEQFQIEGKFSPQMFTSVLSSAGYTPAYFKESLREDIALAQLRSGLAGSEFATPLELDLNAQVDAEQRDLRYLTIPLQTFIDQQQVTEEQISAYFAEHQDDFRTPESVELDYIELTPDLFRQPVEESAVLEAYQLEVENARYKTENRVSHILFERRDGEDADALEQRVEAARARLAAGTAFAELAAEASDDVGSAANGGDLGFSSGDAFPAEMEDAVASLAVGEVSAPVTTDAGTHLLLVTERREGNAPTLEELRPGIEEQLQLAQARGELLLVVENLKDLVFNAEDLSRPASELGLDVQRSEPVARDQAQGLFANPVLLSAAFSEEVLEAGHNSDVIELGEDRFVVLHKHKHNPPRLRELADVRDQIATILIEQSARERVAAEADRIVQELAAGASMEQVATAAGYSWQVELGADRRNGAVPREVLARAFELPVPAQGQILVDFLMAPSGDAQVISLTGVTPGSFEALEQNARISLLRQVSGEYAGLVDSEFQRGLRDGADISVN